MRPSPSSPRKPSSLASAARLARSDQRGLVAIFTALMFTIFIGGAAVAVDVAVWRQRSSVLQAAADAVAISAILDIQSGTSSQTTLQTNAAYEAQKNGCTSGCTVSLTWPYNASSSQVMVTLTQGSAPRFFSVIYDTSNKSLQAKSVAAQSGTTTTTNRFDTACVLATATSGSDRVSFTNGSSSSNPNGTTNPNCEVIANSTDSSAIDIENNAEIAGKATTPGGIMMRNGYTYVGTNNSGSTAVGDPYAGKGGVSSSSAGACSDPMSGGVPQPVNLNGSSMSPNNGSQPFQGGSGGNWSLSGGGHWCKGWNLNNATLTLAAGTYIVDGTFNTSSVTINATSGVTIVWGDSGSGMNVNYNGSTKINITAPALGASVGIPGVVLTNYTNDPGGKTFYFNNNISLVYTGAVYMPNNSIYIQNGSTVQANQGASGCGHIIAYALTGTNQVQLGDTCTLAMGVQPFGTGVSNPAWGGSTTTTTGSGHPVVRQ